MKGRLEPESPAVARLFESGSLGAVEETGGSGTEIVAYFDRQVELGLEGRWEDVETFDYVAAYRAGMKAIRVGPLVVAPTHRRAELEAGQQVVWLDPGSAFGTGHHETTRLALATLAGLDLVGRSVLDVGAGSGILTVAADRLGAGLAVGVDIDAATVEVARRNAVLNRSRARFLTGSVDHPDLPARFDVIVANLYAELHAALDARLSGPPERRRRAAVDRHPDAARAGRTSRAPRGDVVPGGAGGRVVAVRGGPGEPRGGAMRQTR